MTCIGIKYLHYQVIYILIYAKMEIAIHKTKDEWVVFRYDPNEKDRKRNKKSEYRTWAWWRTWLSNAKRYWTEDDAKEALVMMRVLSKKSVW